MKNLKKGFLFTVALFFTTLAFSQQSEYYQRADSLFRDAARKTKCPERAQVLLEYAAWNHRMVLVLASQSSSAGPKPTTPIPPCDGDMVGGGGSNGNAAGSSASNAGAGQVQTGINNITALGNLANTIGPSAKFGIGGDYISTLSGDRGIYFSSGIGISGKVEIPISSTVNFTFGDVEEILNTGTAAQRNHGLEPSYNFNIPKISLKYFISEPLFFEGEGGYAISSSSSVFKSGIAYSFGLGLDAGAFELSGRYESWGDAGDITQLALHVGIRF
jgi:hypothetical protein